jgi:hypothetical protein
MATAVENSDVSAADYYNVSTDEPEHFNSGQIIAEEEYSYHLRICTLARTDDPGDIVSGDGVSWETLRQTLNKAAILADLRVMNVPERLRQNIGDLFA